MKKIAGVVVIALLALWLAGCKQTASQEVSDLKARVAVLETKIGNLEKKIDELTQKIEEMSQAKTGKNLPRRAAGQRARLRKTCRPLRKSEK